MTMHRTTRARLGLAALLAAALGYGLVGVATASDGKGGWVPPDDTIVEVEGDKANGFTVHYYDGSEISPPTDSEAKAECLEYDTRIQRVRCKVEVRTWYRDLADTRDAIRWARADAARTVAEAAEDTAAYVGRGVARR